MRSVKKLPAPPARITSIIVRRSTPALTATASTSSEMQVEVNAIRLFTSFAVFPSPRGPR
jgi:hypothetical protein